MNITDNTLDGPTPSRNTELATAYRGSKTLLRAVELGVFAAFATGPLPPEELRRRSDVHPRAARDDEDVPRYRSTAETDLFDGSGQDQLHRWWALKMAGTRMYGIRGKLTDALRRAPE